VLRAVIFDFNGVLVDDEPVHLEMFQKVLGEESFSLDEKEYYRRYLGMDDRGCFRAFYRDRGERLDESSLAELVRRKARYYRESIEKRIIVFPGVKKLIPELSLRFPLAVASGALRSEIELILQRIGLRDYFRVIVSAEDVREGKPAPEIFLKALSLLNQRETVKPIQPSEALVVEDSKEGILASRRAGMKCLAVANSHPPAELTEAEAMVHGLGEITIPFLQAIF